MKFTSGMLTGMALTIMGSIIYTIMFPESKEELCHCVKNVSKDMKKDIDNMM